LLGLGVTMALVKASRRVLRAPVGEMVTIGQYLQPTAHHHPVMRYWTPDEFKELEVFGYELGFTHVASGPMVRSSYHADRMAKDAGFVELA
jgi:lipoic acid synthetase